MSSDKQWLHWISELRSISQAGLHYCDDHFCQERYQALMNIAAEMASQYSELESQHILEFFFRDRGYLTPKLDTRALIFHEDKVLLVLESTDKRWALPGGWVDVGESPSQSVTREVLEETGLEVEAIRLLALYDQARHHTQPILPYVYKSFFLCIPHGGELTTSAETLDVQYFPVHALPELSLPRVTPEQIQHLYTLSRNPETPTEFD